jgi:P-aminobenzoate N-oxygenase AurF
MNPLRETSFWHKLDPKKDIPQLRQHQAANLFSNFLHGEQGALLATAQIVELAPTADAKFYAAAQVFDEARHVEAYDRYLREKIELVYPISKPLKELLDMILTDSRWDFKFLGMQIMVEGLALGAFGMIHQTTHETLIRQITQLIMQDEARHVAFGVLTLKDAYKDMSPSELRDREDFVILASQLMYRRLLGQEVWERLGFPHAECQDVVNRSHAMSVFRKLCFSKIVPNVKRLGLLTPYVRKGFEELGVIEYENWEATA